MQRYSFLFILLAALAFVGLANATPTVPSGIQYYVAVNITNSQTTATPSPFQQMINITESSFSNYIAYNNNLANFEYFYANGTIIPAWIESNSSGKLITWVKLTPSIPANGKLTIYLGFASKTTNLLSSSGTSGIGEAPQLSSTYAQYDDGASVFNFYDNFAGTSLNTTKWSVYNPNGNTYSVNNGFSSSPTINGGVFVMSKTVYNPQQYIADAYGYASSTATEQAGNWGWVGNQGSAGAGSTQQYFVNTYNNAYYSGIYTGSGGAWYELSNLGTGSTTSDFVMSVYTTTSAVVASINYGSWISNSADFVASTGLSTGFQFGVSGVNFYVQWFRLRAIPPNGVMPSVSFGSFTSSSGASITIPSRINYYMPITITNNQSSATPSPFQQMIQININNYSNYMYFDGNIANFEFFTSTGEIIPAWIESNNNGTLTIWIKLSSGIGANSSITIYLGVVNMNYQINITYPVAFTTEANIVYSSGITASTTLTALTITLSSLQQMNGTIIVEGY